MQLKSMHPLLPASTAAEYGHRAAIGLERHSHETGVALATLFHSDAHDATLHWIRSPSGDAEQLDRHRITEDAAEAIALALVHVARGWVVRRRLQRGESADWLLQDPESGLVALEVSGIDEGEDSDRLRLKLEQVRRATIAEQRSACVVVLSAPRATVAAAWRTAR
ncbi:MAG: hypothetical protein QOF89_1694 [Acidobacteriota bacterium]|jgi:hypothetical protein|nr:hypothetical protein [Acidobacteriota bacterium]